MLDLYKGRASGRQISVTSASIGAACPATTALRWLQALETRGLIQRQEDEHDRRRTEIVLTDAAMIKVAKALQVYL
jgi:DNA-binding HxlR family transcriptional regulator